MSSILWKRPIGVNSKMQWILSIPNPEKPCSDIGCGYGGEPRVALSRKPTPFGKVVGWTLFAKSGERKGKDFLSRFPAGQWELNLGHYREDTCIFDHITSTDQSRWPARLKALRPHYPKTH